MKQIFFFGMFMFIFSATLCAQSGDSAIFQNDSLLVQPENHPIDSFKKVVSRRPAFELKNKILNDEADPVSLAVEYKNVRSKDMFFYMIVFMVLMLAVFKFIYSRYFSTLFRVFFNTSLRQSQLTDQLLQAKLPSLVFNLFFVISGGIYVYILLSYFQLINGNNKWMLMVSSIALLGLVYFIKYFTLKFTGWITGLREVTNTYIFVIFLINKIIGIFLVPFIIILSFSDQSIVNIAVLISLMSIGIFLLLRFYRSYGLLQNLLRISRFHFFLYIIGLEILPLLLIYKGLMVFLSKNL